MPSLFRILNLCWATVMTSIVIMMCILQLPDPPAMSIAGIVFWGIYLALALGVFFDLRVAWALSIVQLMSIWLLIGVEVSDSSFGMLTGQTVNLESPASIAFVVLNSFFGVLVPASVLIMILILSREHLHWLFSKHSRPLEHVEQARKAARQRQKLAARRPRRAA